MTVPQDATELEVGKHASGDMDHGRSISVLESIPLRIRVVLGSVSMPMRDVARLQTGDMVTLERKLGDPVDVLVNDRLVCRGEIGVSEGANPHFILKILEFLSADRCEPFET